MTVTMPDPDYCPKCDDSGFVETFSGGLGGGASTVTQSFCDCLCGDDARRQYAKPDTAKTIETRQGEDACGFVEDESVVAKPFAQPLGLSGIARCADE